MKTAINGTPCVDLEEDAKLSREGVIALQLHSGGPVEARFRRLALEPASECVLRDAGK